MTPPPGQDPVLAATRAWVDTFVIGLNLCPFAKAPQSAGLVRYVHCRATEVEGLAQALVEELQRLAATPPEQLETTLMVHPQVLQAFDDYNDFLDLADALLIELGLEGELQVASFHPDYCFAEVAADDVGNATNQSPFPMLHLIREASIERAVRTPAQSDRIVRANQAALKKLGPEGVERLRAQSACPQDLA